MQNIVLLLVLVPLFTGSITGLLGQHIGRVGAHTLTILGVAISFALSCMLFNHLVIDRAPTLNFNVYDWVVSGKFNFAVGFLVDRLTAIMMLVVTFVSLLVHIYSVGYMKDDPGYQRFFSYISLFTFAMLALVGANNFFQLFFGWEGVGLVSYLLIGFWFDRSSANFGALKAFIVNRVGDFGFILGISGVLALFGSLDFATIFANAPQVAATQAHISIFANSSWSLITVICILLFIGAMGKSAQMPLHVWLPESMEGPTPISALIHAATMVTAGVYMVARLSPLYELSDTALSFILVIGASTALFMGILGVIQNDIKRVIAYSTLSQLGYMMAALGASAFTAGIFHLVTHAAFKALLFLAAGSVIVAMHHEQDMRKMGGLRKYLPLTFVCFLIGALALAAIPPFSGFYSKDAIIEAVHLSAIKGAGYAYFALLISVFITALYIFRAMFKTFFGKERMDAEVKSHLHEGSWTIWLPLIILAIPSLVIGILWAGPMLYQVQGMLTGAICVTAQHDVMAKLAATYPGVWQLAFHALWSLPFWFGIVGIMTAWFFYIKAPHLPQVAQAKFRWLHNVLIKKYGFDAFNQIVFVRGTRKISEVFFRVGDETIIDHYMVNGSGRMISWLSRTLKKMQDGYLYHYALAMIIGVLAFIFWQILVS
jgi:NADH-quinone oxidoreductase subunit L